MLSSFIKNIRFENPILVASGTYGYGDEVKDLVEVEKIGGIITKSVTLLPREGNPPPRIVETNCGMLNSIGLANVGVDNFCKDKVPYLNKLSNNIIINIAGSQIEDYIQTLKKIESSDSNHKGYEINISCPNVKEGGMEFGVCAKTTEKLTSKLRKETNKLLIMKLSPNVTNIGDIALGAENGGADAISAINTVVGMSINIKTLKPNLYTTMGGLSGPAIKPIAIANIYKIYKKVSIPIIGIGGIACADDIIEFILAGAQLVQIGTSNYKYPDISVQLIKDLKKYCISNKIDNIMDLKGQLSTYE